MLMQLTSQGFRLMQPTEQLGSGPVKLHTELCSAVLSVSVQWRSVAQCNQNYSSLVSNPLGVARKPGSCGQDYGTVNPCHSSYSNHFRSSSRVTITLNHFFLPSTGCSKILDSFRPPRDQGKKKKATFLSGQFLWFGPWKLGVCRVLPRYMC